MSLLEVLRVMRRHWVAFLVLLLATVGAAGFVYTRVPLTYQSTSNMIVLPPNTASGEGTSAPVKVNPYANVGVQSTQVAASALAQVANGEQFALDERRRGVTSTIHVEVAALYGGGVVLVLTATSPDPPKAAADLKVVSELISAELQRRQVVAGAPPGSLLTVGDLTAPTRAAPLSSDRTKLGIVSLVIGLVVTSAALVVLESVRRRRGRAAADRDMSVLDLEVSAPADARELVAPGGQAAQAEPASRSTVSTAAR